jgi:hypothetical protein
VKDLARRSNDYTESDYNDALRVLERIYARRTHGIIFLRGGAGKEVVPSNSRNGIQISLPSKPGTPSEDDDTESATGFNELREKALYKVREEIAAEDVRPIILPLNSRYRLIIFADASFAVGILKQSVSG